LLPALAQVHLDKRPHSSDIDISELAFETK